MFYLKSYLKYIYHSRSFTTAYGSIKKPQSTEEHRLFMEKDLNAMTKNADIGGFFSNYDYLSDLDQLWT